MHGVDKPTYNWEGPHCKVGFQWGTKTKHNWMICLWQIRSPHFDLCGVMDILSRGLSTRIIFLAVLRYETILKNGFYSDRPSSPQTTLFVLRFEIF